MPRSRSGRRTSSAPASSVSLPADIFPTPEEITSRAHALFVAGGRRRTKIPEYRLQAEQELLERGARRTLARLAWPRSAPRSRRPS
jgi:hypothetical protein